MNQRFEHCKLESSRITYLGRKGLFEDKLDKKAGEYAAWDYLENQGWELVTAIQGDKTEPVFFFKRPVSA